MAQANIPTAGILSVFEVGELVQVSRSAVSAKNEEIDDWAVWHRLDQQAGSIILSLLSTLRSPQRGISYIVWPQV